MKLALFCPWRMLSNQNAMASNDSETTNPSIMNTIGTFVFSNMKPIADFIVSMSTRPNLSYLVRTFSTTWVMYLNNFSYSWFTLT